MKKSMSFVIAFSLFFMMFSTTSASAVTAKPNVEAEAALLMDMTTGEILYEKNADLELFPASTTKMITCILAIENLDEEGIITVDAEAANAEGNNIELVVGEEVRVIDLLYAMMTESANDGAVALAKAVSGSLPEFTALMNEKAREYGALHTNFVNPNGLQAEEHVSTAYDLAMIAKGCMENETFRKLVSTTAYTMAATNKSEARQFKSTNRLLWDEQDDSSIYVNGVLRKCKYEGTIGIKTGYTSDALGCLVSAVEKEGTTFLCVVLKSSDLGRFADSITLYDWAFQNYKTVSVMAQGSDLGIVKVKRGVVNKVGAVLKQTVAATVPTEASEAILTTEVRLDASVRAPFEKGQVVGEVALFEGGTQVATFSAITADAVLKGGLLSIVGIEDATANIIKKITIITVLVLFLLLVIYILFKRRQVKKRKQERAERLRKKKEQEAEQRFEWDRHYESRYKEYDDYES